MCDLIGINELFFSKLPFGLKKISQDLTAWPVKNALDDFASVVET